MSFPCEILDSIAIGPNYRPLEACDTVIGVYNGDPHGTFATRERAVTKFVLKRSGEIIFTPPVQDEVDRRVIERGINEMVRRKRARRALYQAAINRGGKRTRKAAGQ